MNFLKYTYVSGHVLAGFLFSETTYVGSETLSLPSNSMVQTPTASQTSVQLYSSSINAAQFSKLDEHVYANSCTDSQLSEHLYTNVQRTSQAVSMERVNQSVPSLRPSLSRQYQTKDLCKPLLGLPDYHQPRLAPLNNSKSYQHYRRRRLTNSLSLGDCEGGGGRMRHQYSRGEISQYHNRPHLRQDSPGKLII